jgi:hypothetical protein
LEKLLLPFDSEGDTAHWSAISSTDVFHDVRTLRDVYRFLNAFELALSLTKSGAEFDVNKIDMLVLEMFKFFQPALYAAIRSNRSRLYGSGMDPWHRLSTDKKSVVTELSEFVCPERRSNMERLLKELFPQQSQLLSPSAMKSFYRARRIAHPDFFDRYFALSIPSDQLSPIDQEVLIASTIDPDSFVETAEAIIESKRTSSLITTLSANEARLAKHAESALKSLFGIERLLPLNRAIDFQKPERTVAWIAKGVLENLSLTERIELLDRILPHAGGIYLAVFLVHVIERENSTFFVDSTNHSEATSRTRQETIQRFRGSAARLLEATPPQQLLSHVFAITIMFRWSEWDEKGFADFFKTVLSSEELYVKLLESAEYTEFSSDSANSGDAESSRIVRKYSDIVELSKRSDSLPWLAQRNSELRLGDIERARSMDQALTAYPVADTEDRPND